MPATCKYLPAAELRADDRFQTLFVESYTRLDRELGRTAERPPGQLVQGFEYKLQEENHRFLALYSEQDVPLGFLAFKFLDEAKSKLYISVVVVHEKFWRRRLGTRMLQTLRTDNPHCRLYGLVRTYNTISEQFCHELGAVSWPQVEEWPDDLLAKDQYKGLQMSSWYQPPAQ